jgi:guanylate cyclase
MNQNIMKSLAKSIQRIGIKPEDSDELQLQKTILLISSLMVASAAILWGIIYYAFGHTVAASIPLTYSALSFLSISIFALGRQYQLFRFSQLLLLLLLPFVLMIALGGFVNSSAVILWSLTSPVGAILFLGRRQAIGWFIAYITLVVGSGLLQLLPRQITPLPPNLIVTFFVMNIIGVSAVVFVLLQYFLHQKNQTYRLLNIEQIKSENLLLNVLPKEIASILKEDGGTIADRFESVSILFADLVGFTPLSAEIAPENMIDLLNEIFSYFDTLVEKYGLEKIRTIGDNYMIASGVPVPREDHAYALASLALEIREYLDALPNQYGRKIMFRIGMNSGPVVGGVIGKQKFHYDVWGDAVNLASRMESQGVAGMIQVTNETRELIKDQFICELRGDIDIKGKGLVKTWYLVEGK